MGRALLVLKTAADRERAALWVKAAPPRTRIEFKGPRRSLPQNSRFWAMLTDISTQAEHCGRKYTTEQWKVLFLHACGREVQFLPALDGSTFIPWGQSSSELSIEEMTALIEFMFAWGAEHGVTFNEPERAPTIGEAA